jgi:mannan polymerase II complex MNN10 subunit
MSLPVSYGEKEKLGRGRYQNNRLVQLLNRIGWNLWRLRRSLGVILLVIFTVIMFYVTRRSTTTIIPPWY